MVEQDNISIKFSIYITLLYHDESPPLVSKGFLSCLVIAGVFLYVTEDFFL